MENPIYKYRKSKEISLQKLSDIICDKLVCKISVDALKTAEGFFNYKAERILDIINSLNIIFDDFNKNEMYSQYIKWRDLRKETINTKFISFGLDKLDKNKFDNISNSLVRMNKPDGGLWLSPKLEDGKYISSWERWCKENRALYLLSNNYISIDLRADARIFVIDSYECFKEMIEIYGEKDIDYFMFKTFVSPDFENVSKRYDGIYLTEKGFNETHMPIQRDFRFNLYGWDCSSLLLFNIDCIESYESFKYGNEIKLEKGENISHGFN